MIATAIGVGAFFLAGSVVSFRLLALWRQTRQLPELLCGLSMLGIGPLGFCLITAGMLAFPRTPLGANIVFLGLVIQALGFLFGACFTWKELAAIGPSANT